MASSTADPKPRRGLGLKTLVLLVALALFGVFCAMNRQSTRVWPLGDAPVFLVLLLTFGLGGGLGFMVRSMGVGAKRRG